VKGIFKLKVIFSSSNVRPLNGELVLVNKQENVLACSSYLFHPAARRRLPITRPRVKLHEATTAGSLARLMHIPDLIILAACHVP
jgi:hypothetical protein